jgi:carbon monoxide dehydrogenase subunit G
VGNLNGTASEVVEAPLAEVWAVVEDTETAPDWQNGMDRMEVLERDAQGRPEVVQTETDASVRTVKSKVRFSYDGPTRLSWEQIKGDLKHVVGSWDLEDLGDGRTRVTYTLDGDPGRMLGMLVRGPVESQIRKVLVDSRPGELKARVEGAG